MASTFSGDAANIQIGTARLLHLAASGTTGSITGASAANPCVITDVAHGLASGDRISIASVVGMTELNTRSYLIEKIDADSFKLVGVDSSAYTAYSSAGTWTKYTVTDLGYLADGVEVEWAQNWGDVTGDQDGQTVLDRVNLGGNATITCALREPTVANLNRLLLNAVIVGTTTLHYGGELAGSVRAYDSAFTLVAHPVEDSDITVTREIWIWKALCTDTVRTMMKNGSMMDLPAVFTGFPDRSRTRGQRIVTYGADQYSA